MSQLHPWYAIRVRSNFEKITGAALHGRGYHEFVPLYTKRTQWCDRIASLELPLFPGYIFCRLNIEHRLPVVTTPGVVNIVGFGKDFIPIPDPEIEALQTLLSSGAQIRPWPYLKIGQRVRIERGSLAGLEGILQSEQSNDRLILSVDLLMRSVAVHLDRSWIQPLN